MEWSRFALDKLRIFAVVGIGVERNSCPQGRRNRLISLFYARLTKARKVLRCDGGDFPAVLGCVRRRRRCYLKVGERPLNGERW